jgi:hypothetical protein
VKHLFLKILVLVIGFAYVSSVFELDKDECKQNYAKEQCFKVCCTKATDSKTVFKIATLQPALLSSFNCHFSFSATTNKIDFTFFNQIIRPDKIFLRHRALLI